MARLALKYDSDIFGHRISLIRGEQLDVIGENIQYDVKRRLTKLRAGYLFRNPNCQPDDMRSLWDTVEGLTGKVDIWMEEHGKSGTDDKWLTAYARLEDQQDATMFAFAHMEFQKWSDQQDKADRAERRRKPTVLKVRKDGTVRVKATVTTLTD